MYQIYKLERGASALRRFTNSPGRIGNARVVGGTKLKNNSRVIRKTSDIKRMAERISKLTPGGSSVAKRSASRFATGNTPGLPSPGAGSGAGGTTNHQSMEEFKKMMVYFKKKYKNDKGATTCSVGGKSPAGAKKTGGKLSSKLSRSGKGSRK